MQIADGLVKRGESMAFAEARVEQFGQIGFLQRHPDQPAQRSLRNAGRRRVDGRQCRGQCGILVDDAIAGMHHFRPEKALADFAEEAQRAAAVASRFELLRLTAVEVEEAQHQFATAGALVMHPRDQLAARTELHGDIDDAGFHLHRFAPGRFRQCVADGFVLVTQRQVEDEIVVAGEPQLAELFRQRRRRLDPVRSGHYCPRTMTASASTSAPRGSEATPTAARAG